ncbi:hypothetical protein GGE48_003319 [Rhizobium leguminosarum]|nr:hypothetical protein [Rhizobium leguminosarum]
MFSLKLLIFKLVMDTGLVALKADGLIARIR